MTRKAIVMGATSGIGWQNTELDEEKETDLVALWRLIPRWLWTRLYIR